MPVGFTTIVNIIKNDINSREKKNEQVLKTSANEEELLGVQYMITQRGSSQEMSFMKCVT